MFQDDINTGYILDKNKIQNVTLYGENFPEKLRLAFGKNKLEDIQEKYKISRQMLSYVIKGQKKSKRVEAILEQEYGLTLAEIQELIIEHITRMEEGNPITLEEAFEWDRQRRSKRTGLYVPYIPPGLDARNFYKRRQAYYKRKQKEQA